MESTVEFDSAWCPSCDRQIAPKRYLVPVLPDAQLQQPVPQQQQSPEQPTSPQTAKVAAKKPKQAVFTRGGGRQGGVRYKHVAALKRTDSTKSATSPQQQQPQPQQPAQPVKFRTVIDQSPIPLYCSDECQRADINSVRGGSSVSSHDIASEVTLESEFSPSPTDTVEPSIAALAAYYNFPSLPTTPAVFEESEVSYQTEYPSEYTSGIMMAAKRIQAYYPKPVKRSPFDFSAPSKERKTVRGWNDGSNSWRASVYSFSSPKNSADPLQSEQATKAYRSFTASPHRSRPVAPVVADTSAHAAAAATAANEELQIKFADSFARRPTHSVSLLSPQRKERSILKPGAEGRLLVPDVKLKACNGSSASLAQQARRAAAKARSEASEEDSERKETASLPPTDRRPVVESRSLSYDNLKTYPIMQMPRRKETRLERRLVDGVEVFVEIEVEVEADTQRLFNFPIPWEEHQRRRALRR